MAKRQETPDTPRSPDDVDKFVGKRVRMRRSLLGISQENLAKSVNLTFQQIQKYERGVNRVSAGRLYQFSRILDVPIPFFFDGYEENKKGAQGFADNNQAQYSNADVTSKESLDVLKLYYSISDDQKKRKEFLKIIKTMADNWSG